VSAWRRESSLQRESGNMTACVDTHCPVCYRAGGEESEDEDVVFCAGLHFGGTCSTGQNIIQSSDKVTQNHRLKLTPFDKSGTGLDQTLTH
jgi:hypothetical protein